MRKQLLAVLLPLLILALIAGAETQSTSAGADNRATVQKVDVMHADDGISVEITAHGQVTPKLSALASPARVLVTLPNTVAATVQNHISVGSDGVKGVRIGTDGHMPPTTSVVIDLVQACSYELLSAGENRIIVKLHPAAAKSSAKAATHALPKTVLAVSKPAPVATVSADAKTSKQIASATDFVVVEPTYQQKKATEPDTTNPAPAVRAAGAAAKFVDKPEGNLLPGQSAAMQSETPQATAATPATPAAQTADAPQTTPAVQTADAPQATPAVQTTDAPQTTPAAQAPETTQTAPATQTAAPQTVQMTQTAPAAPTAQPAQAAQATQTVQATQTAQPTQTAQASTPTFQPAVNLAAEQKGEGKLVTPITTAKYTGEPISVNLKDVDLKDFFRLIHEISGLNVVLDPQVKGSLTIVLDDVPWDQALDIVLKNNELARQLDGNVLRIATVETLRHEADSRRAEQEAEALAVEKQTVTRFLSYAHSKDVIPTVKKFLSQRGDVVADERTNAVIISDIPAVMPNVDRLLTQLDRKTQEVEIEARVVAATRSFGREIGTQLGFGWGNAASSVGGVPAVGITPTSAFGILPRYPIIGTTAPTPTTGTQIPLFSNLGLAGPTSGFSFLNVSNSVRIDALLSMAESRGLLKILSRPRVVTQNNIQALVRQGVRVPIVTQAQLGGPPTVTYIDAFLRLTVVPQITSEGTIFLNVDVENTTPDFGRTINGNPTLITQQATTQVLVTDGGTVVIGGVIQTNNSVSVSQVPLLGSIPYLGNLFKHTNVATSNQELIFFITPRIIQT
jgi:type IV pilus secretin PilQ/predicted competence protein